MTCRVPLLTLSQVTALRGMFRLYFGTKMAAIETAVRASYNDQDRAVHVALKTAADVMDDLEETRDFLVNLEWVYITEDVQGPNGCAMNEDLYNILLHIVHAPLPMLGNTHKLAPTLKMAQDYKEALIAAFTNAACVEDEELAEQGDAVLDKVAAATKSLLN